MNEHACVKRGECYIKYETKQDKRWQICENNTLNLIFWSKMTINVTFKLAKLQQLFFPLIFNRKCPNSASVHTYVSDYSVCVCHHGGKTASLQSSSDTNHSLQKALD